MFLNRDRSVGVVIVYGLNYSGLVLNGARDSPALRHDRVLVPTSFLVSGYLGLISRGLSGLSLKVTNHLLVEGVPFTWNHDEIGYFIMFYLFAMLVDNACKQVTQFSRTLFDTLPVNAAVATLIRRCRWSRSRTFSEDTEVFSLPHKNKSKKLKSDDLCDRSYGYLLIQ
jgi:hypothetical protein